MSSIKFSVRLRSVLLRYLDSVPAIQAIVLCGAVAAIQASDSSECLSVTADMLSGCFMRTFQRRCAGAVVPVLHLERSGAVVPVLGLRCCAGEASECSGAVAPDQAGD